MMCNRYWTQASKIAGEMAQHRTLQRKISLRDFQQTCPGGEAAWQKTTQAQDLFAQIKAYEGEEKMYQRQGLRLTEGGVRKTFRRCFIELFTTSKIGLGINSAGQGKRDARQQSKFRKALIEAYDSAHPDYGRSNEYLWDPVLKKWVDRSVIQAAHLFAYRHGQVAMDAIFGPTKPSELFSPLNGLLLSNTIERFFDKGFFTIVPRLPDNPSVKDVMAWNDSKVKEYKIRILNYEHPKIDHEFEPGFTYRCLDNSNVEFRNDFRPKARYLYFHYCLQILRLSWGRQKKDGAALNKELKKAYWGTPGRYLSRHMLLAFVEELGHEYKTLILQGAIEDEDDSADLNPSESEILLKISLDHVKKPVDKDDDIETVDDDDDDDDDDDHDDDNDHDADDDDDDDDEDGDDEDHYKSHPIR